LSFFISTFCLRLDTLNGRVNVSYAETGCNALKKLSNEASFTKKYGRIRGRLHK
jgi:hypothetical protein